MARVPNARLAALALCAVLGLTLASGVEVGAATSLRASARDDAAAAAAQDADADADPLSIARMRWNALWDGAVGASRVQAAAAEPASPVHQDQTLRANVVLVLLLGMLLLAVGFDAAKRAIIRLASPNLKEAALMMLKQSAVLGFLGLFGFVVLKSQVLTDASPAVLPGEPSTSLKGLFEDACFVVFITSLLLTLSCVYVLAAAEWLSRRWHEFEICPAMDMLREFAEAAAARASGARQTFEQQRRIAKDYERAEYANVRRDFLRPVLTLSDEPLDADFRFSQYLTTMLARVVARMIDMPASSWVFLAAGLVAVKLAVGADVVTQLVVFGALGYLALLATLLLLRRVLRTYDQIVTQSPALQQLEQIGRSWHPLPKPDDPRFVEMLNLMLDALLYPKAFVPPALKLPLNDRRRTKGVVRVLTPQHALMPFGDRALDFFVFSLRISLYFIVLYLAAGLVHVFGAAVGMFGAAGWLLVAFLLAPPLAMLPAMSRMLAPLVIITSIEDMRDERTVREIVHRQHAQQEDSAHALLLELAMRRVAEGGKVAVEPGLSKSRELRDALNGVFSSMDLEGRHAVDAHGLGVLLQRVGMPASSQDLLFRLADQADPAKAAPENKCISRKAFRKLVLRLLSARRNAYDTARVTFDRCPSYAKNGYLDKGDFMDLVGDAAQAAGISRDVLEFMFRETDDVMQGWINSDEFAGMLHSHASRRTRYRPPGEEGYEEDMRIGDVVNQMAASEAHASPPRED